MNPGYVPVVELHTGLTPRGISSRINLDTEAKSGHKPINSNVGLLSKDTVKSTPATDSSYVATTPAAQSPRELPPVESEERAMDEDGPISPAIFGTNPLQTDRDSVSYEGEIVENTEGQQEVPSTVPIPLPPKSDERRVTYETRYCTICRIEQPVRAKHCKACNRCISLYDHHCPWLGVCIAERNRLYFYWYLIAESLLLLYSLFLVTSTQTFPVVHRADSLFHWFESNGVALSALIIESCFAMMVWSLLAFHSYLACVNTTTWEHLSWTKISYLRDWPRQHGSPFSRGPCRNYVRYCCPPKESQVWVLPQTLPDEKTRNCC